MKLLENDDKISDDITSLWTELIKYSINAENSTFSELLTRMKRKKALHLLN